MHSHGFFGSAMSYGNMHICHSVVFAGRRREREKTDIHALSCCGSPIQTAKWEMYPRTTFMKNHCNHKVFHRSDRIKHFAYAILEAAVLCSVCLLSLHDFCSAQFSHFQAQFIWWCECMISCYSLLFRPEKSTIEWVTPQNEHDVEITQQINDNIIAPNSIYSADLMPFEVESNMNDIGSVRGEYEIKRCFILSNETFFHIFFKISKHEPTAAAVISIQWWAIVNIESMFCMHCQCIPHSALVMLQLIETNTQYGVLYDAREKTG